MSVQTQIERINQNVANTYAVLYALGATLPAEQNSDNLMRTAGTVKLPTKVSELENDAGYISKKDVSWLDGYNIPRLYLTGDTTGMSKDVAVTLTYTCRDKDNVQRAGSCTLKWQGNSSLLYDKKNYTIKLDNAIEMVDGWTAQKKYCLKANFIDHSHARNVVSAKLWGQVVKSRSNVDSRLAELPNAGAVDGFPIVIILNGEFHGLYTWNIPKDGWMFGMVEGSSTPQAIVCADKYVDATKFHALAALDGSDFDLEYSSDGESAWVVNSINTMIQAVMDSNGGNIDTVLAKYIDIESAIDHMIFTTLIEAADCVQKNYLLVTYDGVKWFFSGYDMDSTFGLHSDGLDFSGLASAPTFTHWTLNKLMELLWKYKRGAIRERYTALRAGAMSENNVAKTFWNFCCLTPKGILNRDVAKWTSIPSSAVSDVHQILHQYRLRVLLADEWIKNTTGESEPPAAYTNLVPTSIDTDGSVFNGVGYKDGVRLNSSGVTASEQYATATGFITAKKGDVFRLTGQRFGTQAQVGAYCYVATYDSAKVKIASVSMDNYAGNPSGYGHVVTQTGTTHTDVTTIDLSGVPESVAFVRFNASRMTGTADKYDASIVTSGADLIVTKNEEIV